MNSGQHSAHRGSRGRRDRFGQPIPPGTTLKPLGRVLTCTDCHTPVDVLEASVGARTLTEHRHLDAASYRCGTCLDPPLFPERNPE